MKKSILVSSAVFSSIALSHKARAFTSDGATLNFQKVHSNYISSVDVIGVIAIIALAVLSIMLYKRAKALSRATHALENFNELRQTFIDAYPGYIYLKDENLKYVFVNKNFAESVGLSTESIIGNDNSIVFEAKYVKEFSSTDLYALEQHKLVEGSAAIGERHFKTIKFPVRMQNGAFGVGTYIRDVTQELEQLREQERALKRNELLYDVLSKHFNSKQEQLDYALHELLKLSGSEFGYIYFYNEEKEEFVLNTWTEGVMRECKVKGEPKIYKLDKTGIWGEVVRQRKPIIVNDFNKPNELKKGYPEGHVALKRFMSIPVFIDGKIVAVIGFANKSAEYSQEDIKEISMLMSGVWNAVERREANEALSYERSKYLKTLLSIDDGVTIIGRDRKIEFMNTVACRLTGWKLEDAVGSNYLDVFSLSYEEGRAASHNPIEMAFSTGKVQALGEQIVMKSKTGEKYYLEDSSSPIADEKGLVAGVVLVFRDVTEKRAQLKRIEYMSFHDALTGLYNRRFFEEELKRLDTGRNLPISILMGDTNNLKLVNDIFGHSFGDTLLTKITEVMKNSCRADDILARYGGDEFVLLLPRTGSDEVEQVAQRIKKGISLQRVSAIGCSISIGYDTKTEESTDIIRVLRNAETNMYSAKTLERSEVEKRELEAIIDALHTSNKREMLHSKRVSQMAKRLGKALKLSEAEIKKLELAGRLHDIGKVVLDPSLLDKGHEFNPKEQKERDQHPIIGYRILNYFDDTLELAEIVLAHHENWDGSGYPKGLKGEAIPLLARILSIAGAYEQMMHPNTQNEAKSLEEAVLELERELGVLYDPIIGAAFIELLRSA